MTQPNPIIDLAAYLDSPTRKHATAKALQLDKDLEEQLLRLGTFLIQQAGLMLSL